MDRMVDMLGALAAIAAIVASPLASRSLPTEVRTGDSVRYFAFGSNLLLSKLENRSGFSVLERLPASVADHRLAFNMRMFPPLEPAMASIEPLVGDVCEGVLYTLTSEAYEELWRSEGGSMARPGYEEVVVTCDASTGPVRAITLRAAPWMRLRRDAPPSLRYKSLIVEGAREAGFTSGYLSRLDALPAATPGRALAWLARAHGVIAVLCFKLGLRRLLAPLRSLCYTFSSTMGLTRRSRARRRLRPRAPSCRPHCWVRRYGACCASPARSGGWRSGRLP